MSLTLTEQTGAQAPPRPARPAVSARAVLLGLALAVANVWVVVQGVWRWGYFVGYGTLMDNAIAVLFTLALLNLALRRWCRGLAFSGGEILVIYLMVFTGTGLTAHLLDFGGALAGTISYPFWLATPENQWRDLLWPNLPAWLTVQDPKALEGFFLGNSSPYSWTVLQAWGGPILWWTGFVTVLMGTALCLNSIVRRRWADEEKLPFPITVLPVQLADERFSLLSSKLFWVGVALSAGLDLWGALARFVPSLPGLPLGIDLGSYATNHPPWNAIRATNLWWPPGALGLCYLMPLDLALSLVIFTLLWDAEHVTCALLGWTTSGWSGFPYADNQAAGSYIALLLTVLWLDRRYGLHVLRTALGLPSPLRDDDPREAMRYRTAVLGAALGGGALWWFLHRGGMGAAVGFSFLGLYGIMLLVLSRLRAQLGPPAHELYQATPDAILKSVVGTRALGASTLGMFALLSPYLKSQADHPGPVQLEALKMAEGGRMEPRRLAAALLLVVPIAILAYFWASLHVGFHTGLTSGGASFSNSLSQSWVYDDVTATLRTPGERNTATGAAMGVGMLATVVLMLLKVRFPWWPLHPAAFALASAYSIQGLIAAIFVTWLTKSLLLRYGGLRAHRAALPLFLGLIAGGSTAFFLRGALYLALGLTMF